MDVEVSKLKRAKKKKTQLRREWTTADVKSLKKHSKARTPVAKVSKELRRTIGAVRVKASQFGIGVGHQRQV
ncbi:hypothetical protein AAFG07_33385 [Bradyrhizobium sp. B097]|uniref:hypothetical protein n=1 Tax=Bradyrhizobium sp. B097 TaxID=3140244 RepID=UPI00318344E5